MENGRRAREIWEFEMVSQGKPGCVWRFLRQIALKTRNDTEATNLSCHGVSLQFWPPVCPAGDWGYAIKEDAESLRGSSVLRLLKSSKFHGVDVRVACFEQQEWQWQEARKGNYSIIFQNAIFISLIYMVYSTHGSCTCRHPLWFHRILICGSFSIPNSVQRLQSTSSINLWGHLRSWLVCLNWRMKSYRLLEVCMVAKILQMGRLMTQTLFGDAVIHCHHDFLITSSWKRPMDLRTFLHRSSNLIGPY